MTTQLLSSRVGTKRAKRSLLVVMLVAALAIFASAFGGAWAVNADEHNGTSPTTVPTTVPPTPEPTPDPTPEPTPAPDPDAPARPEMAIAVAGDREVGVVWAAPRTGAPGDVVSYIVTSTSNDVAHVVDAPVRHVIVEGLINGQEYVFSVVAVGPGGTSASANTNAVTPDVDESFEPELLEKLERHLQDQLNKAHGRFQNAKGKALAKFEKQEGRALANFHKHVGQAESRFQRFEGKMLAKLERARGTARFERVYAQTTEQLERAEARLVEQISSLEERLDDKLGDLTERLHEQLNKLHEKLAEHLRHLREQLLERIEGGDDSPESDEFEPVEGDNQIAPDLQPQSVI